MKKLKIVNKFYKDICHIEENQYLASEIELCSRGYDYYFHNYKCLEHDKVFSILWHILKFKQTYEYLL